MDFHVVLSSVLLADRDGELAWKVVKTPLIRGRPGRRVVTG